MPTTATSAVAALAAKAAIKDRPSKFSIKAWCQSAEKLFQQYDRSYADGDFETAYIALQRYHTIVTDVIPHHPENLRLIRANDASSVNLRKQYQMHLKLAEAALPRLNTLKQLLISPTPAPVYENDLDEPLIDELESGYELDDYFDFPPPKRQEKKTDQIKPSTPAPQPNIVPSNYLDFGDYSWLPKSDRQQLDLQPPLMPEESSFFNVPQSFGQQQQQQQPAYNTSLNGVWNDNIFPSSSYSTSQQPNPFVQVIDSSNPYLLVDYSTPTNESVNTSLPATSVQPTPPLFSNTNPPLIPTDDEPIKKNNNNNNNKLFEQTMPSAASVLDATILIAKHPTLFGAPPSGTSSSSSSSLSSSSSVRRPFMPTEPTQVKVNRNANDVIQGNKQMPSSMSSYNESNNRTRAASLFETNYHFVPQYKPPPAPKSVPKPNGSHYVDVDRSTNNSVGMQSAPRRAPVPLVAPTPAAAASIPVRTMPPPRTSSPRAPVPQPSNIFSQLSVSNGLAGFKNLGNTCYMNSTLQCLSSTLILTRSFLDGGYKKWLNQDNPLGSGGKVAEAYGELMRTVWLNQQSVVSPHRFKSAISQFAPQFSGDDQHDSQELLGFLLDGLHEDLNIVKVKPVVVDPDSDGTNISDEELSRISWANYLCRNNSLIVKLFQGQYKSEVACLTCGKKSVSFNAFMYLSLPLAENTSNININVTLYHCLEKFTQPEILEEADGWFCSNCQQVRRASKQLLLWRLPSYLLIHLKRFSFNGPWKSKINTYIHFPLRQLDLSDFLCRGADPSPQYDLYAVSNHYGGLNGGHYTAFCKHNYLKRWHNFDDSRISVIPETDAQSSAAYILFYVRQDS